MAEIIRMGASPRKVKKPFIPTSKDPSLNLYSPSDIMKAGGIAAFNKFIANDKPISPPNIHFAEEKWNDMMKYLD